MNGVLIGSDDGLCTDVTIKRSERGNWTMGRTKLHLHHCVKGIALLSPLDLRHMQSLHASVFEYPLPPPLDAYVYPEKLIVIRYDDQTETVDSISSGEFINFCAELVATSQCTDVVEAVYDVPAIPINYDEEEDDREYVSDDDDDVLDSNDEDEQEVDDEDDWEDDDDIRSNV